MAVYKCSFMECTLFPVHVIVMLSANNWVFIDGLKLRVMSLICIKNSVMLITDPCGTPFLIITGCDMILLYGNFAFCALPFYRSYPDLL